MSVDVVARSVTGTTGVSRGRIVVGTLTDGVIKEVGMLSVTRNDARVLAGEGTLSGGGGENGGGNGGSE